MKYGQQFQRLAEENPAFTKWDTSVTKYKAVRAFCACFDWMYAQNSFHVQLKKIINSISQELQSAGLEAHILKHLLNKGNSDLDKTSYAEAPIDFSDVSVHAEYELKGSFSHAPIFRLPLIFIGLQAPQ